jgi:hypothetical protein
MVQSVFRWYIGECEHVPPEDILHHILNFLAHISQCTTWGRFALYFKLLSSHCPMYHELRSLKYDAKRLRMVHWEMWAKKFKYGAKHPQVVHWARWAKKNFLAHIAQCITWWPLHPILNFLAHIAQCITWWRFAPYFKFLSSHCPMYHLMTLCNIFKLLSSPCPMYHLRTLCTKRPQVIHWAIWAKKLKIWSKASSCGTLGNVS